MPDCPPELQYLWAWFQRLDATRAPAGFAGGKSAITETEIGAFFVNRRISPRPWEIELIASLDLLAMTQQDDE